jgi:hypothetical protein
MLGVMFELCMHFLILGVMYANSEELCMHFLMLSSNLVVMYAFSDSGSNLGVLYGVFYKSGSIYKRLLPCYWKFVMNFMQGI